MHSADPCYCRAAGIDHPAITAGVPRPLGAGGFGNASGRRSRRLAATTAASRSRRLCVTVSTASQQSSSGLATRLPDALGDRGLVAAPGTWRCLRKGFGAAFRDDPQGDTWLRSPLQSFDRCPAHVVAAQAVKAARRVGLPTREVTCRYPLDSSVVAAAARTRRRDVCRPFLVCVRGGHAVTSCRTRGAARRRPRAGYGVQAHRSRTGPLARGQQTAPHLVPLVRGRHVRGRQTRRTTRRQPPTRSRLKDLHPQVS